VVESHFVSVHASEPWDATDHTRDFTRWVLDAHRCITVLYNFIT